MTRAADTRTRRRDPTRHYGPIGLVLAVLLLVGVYLSYSANNGLPLVRSYHVTVELPNADRLIRNNEVRIGGVRVGQVDSVSAETGRGGAAPVARVGLKLDPDVGKLPTDTVAKVRPASILGATYVDLVLGQARTTVADDGTLPLRQAQSTVELTDLLNIFTPDAGRDLQRALIRVGDGLAGRGGALNRTIAGLGAALGPVSRVSRTLAAPDTRLPALITSYARVIRRFAADAPAVARGLTGAARTFGATADARAALGATLDRVPTAELATTSALNHLRPALESLDALVVDLRPAVRRLDGTTRSIFTTLDAGDPALRRLPPFATRLDDALGVVRRVSLRAGTNGALRKLRDTATAVRPTLDVLTPMQTQCNSIGIWAESFASTFGTLGAGEGPAIANIGVTHIGAENELFQNASASPNVGVNYLPNEDGTECESGNEPFVGKQLLNNPPGLQPNTTRPTSPIAGVAVRQARYEARMRRAAR